MNNFPKPSNSFLQITYFALTSFTQQVIYQTHDFPLPLSHLPLSCAPIPVNGTKMLSIVQLGS